MPSYRGDVIAIEQRVQHVGCHRHDLSLVVWPDEVAALQSLYKKPETTAVPAKNLYSVTTSVSEDGVFAEKCDGFS